MTHTYKALLIDCDGTIVPDAEEIHKNTARRTLQDLHTQHGLSFDEEVFSSVWFAQLGKGMTNFYQCYVRQSPVLAGCLAGSLDEQTVRFEQTYEKNYETHLKANMLTVRKGLADLIQGARARGMKIAAVSNATQTVLENTINACGLPPFDLILGKDTVARMGYAAKPEAGSYLCACDTLNVAPGDCIGFEDTFSGYSSLVKAGIGLRVYCRNGSDDDFQKRLARENMPPPHITIDPHMCTKHAVVSHIVSRRSYGGPSRSNGPA